MGHNLEVPYCTFRFLVLEAKLFVMGYMEVVTL